MDTNNLTPVLRVSDTELVRRPHGSRQALHAELYIATLTTDSGRRSMRSALKQIAKTCFGTDDINAVTWANIEASHVTAIRAVLVDELDYAPATINKTLAALRGVLKAAWRYEASSKRLGVTTR